jgi:hypothetical protein
MPEPITAVKSEEKYTPSEVLVELTSTHLFGMEFINPQFTAKIIGVVKKEELEKSDSYILNVYYPEILVFTIEQQIGMNGMPLPGQATNIVPMSKPIKIDKVENEYKIMLPKNSYVIDILSTDPLDIASHKKEYEDAVVKIKTEALSNIPKTNTLQ